jgi:hypothetical protein
MGIDIHVHDVYLAVAHGPMAIVLAVLLLAAIFFVAWKLIHLVLMALAR